MDLQSFVPKKILVCQLKQIGDVLLMTPALELLAKRYPQAEIHVLTEKRCVPVLENNPFIKRIWPIDKKALPNLFSEVAYYYTIARQGFDLVVDFQQTPRCRWVVGFSRATVRLTRTPPWYTRWLYTHWSKIPPLYASAMKVAFLAPLGISWNGEAPRFYLLPEETRWAQSYLAGMGLQPGDRLITVDPTHNRITRRWPAASFAKLLDLAAAQDASLRFMLLYGPGEEHIVRELYEAVSAKDRVMLPEKIITLREVGACIAQAVMHVGTCSAPRHMAVGVGTPSFTILGATSAGWTYPSPQHTHINLGLECQPCNKNSCDIGVRCLTELSPESVLPHMMAHLHTQQ